VPLRNRVTPFGEIVAVPGRGGLMGNRGILHTPDGQLVRDSQVRRWIACRLEFRGRHHPVLAPGTWTALFFLDEAAALAVGHRPCAECRRADYVAFQSAWRQVYPSATASADAMDAVLHAERRVRPWVKRTYPAELADLQDGVYVALDDRAWLVLDRELLAWSTDGYVDRRRRPAHAEVTVLSPPSVVAVLRAGYPVGLHPGARPEPT
jgi:hypothetical protein